MCEICKSVMNMDMEIDKWGKKLLGISNISKGWKSFHWLTRRNQAASMKSCIVWIFLKLYTAQSAYEAVFDLKLQLARCKKGGEKKSPTTIHRVHRNGSFDPNRPNPGRPKICFGLWMIGHSPHSSNPSHL